MNKSIKIRIMLETMILLVLINNVSAISSSINVDVVETRDLKVYYIPIDNITHTNFENGKSNFDSFIEDVYPLADDGLVSNQRENNFNVAGSGILSDYQRGLLLLKISIATKLSGSKYGVGIVRKNWIKDRIGWDATGITYANFPSVVLAQSDQIKTAGHEIGHKPPFYLCDENNITVWTDQNNSIMGGCSNGDLDGDGFLDQVCVNNRGCPTSTFSELYSYEDITESTTLRNFMGPYDDPNLDEKGTGLDFESWVSNNTYDVLSNELEKSELEKTLGLVINFLLYKNGTTELVSSYSSDNLLLSEQNDFVNIDGNFSTRTLDLNNDILDNITFDAEFNLITETGELAPSHIRIIK